MTAGRRQQMEQLLLTQLPSDGAAIGNGKLCELKREAAKSAGDLRMRACSAAQS